MGLPAEKFESIEMYMPRRAFYVIQGGNTQEGEPIVPEETQLAEIEAVKDLEKSTESVDYFRDLHKYVNKIGHDFWMEEVVDTTDPSEKLVYLSMATRHLKPRGTDISETNTEIKDLIKASFRPPVDLIDLAHSNIISKVPNYLAKKDKKGHYPRLDYTYGEVHDISEVRFAALNALRRNNDPAVEVVRSFEGWRYAGDKSFSNDQLELGRLAFETYLFSVGSGKFLRALGRAATAYLAK